MFPYVLIGTSNELLNKLYLSRADFTYNATFKRYTKIDDLLSFRNWHFAGSVCPVMKELLVHIKAFRRSSPSLVHPRANPPSPAFGARIT